jgi:Protein of unknown function (DUF4065)
MQLRFDETKTTQAAARFLRLAGGELNYMMLIKLLYLLDREALLRWGRPVSFDTFYSMSLGPVLSTVLDLITEPPIPQHESVWNKVISSPENYRVKLLKEIGTDDLSEAEDALIDELFEKFGEPYKDRPFALVDLLHKKLPEWKKVEKGERLPLDIRDILLAGYKSAEDILAIEEELESLGIMSAFA